jgi:hypothetical protein
MVAGSAIHLNRPREALEVLEPIGLQSFPGYNPAWWPVSSYTAAHHMLGEHERELQYANLGRERFPDVVFLFRVKTRALAALGQTEAVNQVIDEILRTQTGGGSAGYVMLVSACELRVHGHREASDAMVARAVEWFEGHGSFFVTRPQARLPFSAALQAARRPEEARIVLHELADIIQDDARTVETTQYDLRLHLAVRGSLGINAAVIGHRDEAQRISDTLPIGDNPWVKADRPYWRACIAARLGDKDRAIELLTESFSKGRSYMVPYGAMLHAVPELEPLWNYPPFQELIRPKG